MTIYSLYKKTHRKTGLMYLGRTTKDPFKYNGSGLYWTRHLKKHGNDHITEIIGQYDTLEQLAEAGLDYSIKYDIVASPKWANIVPETGYSTQMTDEIKAKISASLKRRPGGNNQRGRKRSPEHIAAMIAGRGKRAMSAEHKRKLAEGYRRYNERMGFGQKKKGHPLGCPSLRRRHA